MNDKPGYLALWLEMVGKVNTDPRFKLASEKMKKLEIVVLIIAATDPKTADVENLITLAKAAL